MATIFTIGHSNRTIDEFIAILNHYKITHLVDARSRPFSKYAPQYNRFSLEKALESNGISYLYRGQSVGGLDVNKRQEEVLDGLAQFAKNGMRMALCCAEKLPHDCHLCTVIAPLLNARGVEVEHLISVSETETHRSVKQEKLFDD